MNKQVVDLLVVGAGASGSCIAYEATRRGLKVALLDTGDIGGGTSCRSTKLLHGGVRYLELAFKNFDLGQFLLVKEALVERSHWIKEVPFLARRIELALPTKNCFEKAYYRAGLGVYDALAGSSGIGSSRLLSMAQLKNALPFLRNDLNGGAVYSDGQFDDARLNILLALTAEQEGAVLKSYCRVIDFEKGNNGKLVAAISEDSRGQRQRWECNAVVNATGIHSDNLRQLVEPGISPRILISRGIHMVLKQNLCPEGMGMLLPNTNDGRVLFFLPFFGYTQIGTTDTPCSIESATKPSEEEKSYLVNYVNHWFPEHKNLSIKSCWAGGRPLLNTTTKGMSSSRLVREHEIETLPCGLISAMGGKWTSCRRIALDTLKAVEITLDRKLPQPKTVPIIGAALNPNNTNLLLAKERKLLEELLPQSIQKERQISHLQNSYGLKARSILSKGPKTDCEPLSDIIPICEAEIKHAIHEEHALTATDILARRCRLAMVDFEEANRILPIISSHLNQAGLSEGNLNLEQ